MEVIGLNKQKKVVLTEYDEVHYTIQQIRLLASSSVIPIVLNYSDKQNGLCCSVLMRNNDMEIEIISEHTTETDAIDTFASVTNEINCVLFGTRHIKIYQSFQQGKCVVAKYKKIKYTNRRGLLENMSLLENVNVEYEEGDVEKKHVIINPTSQDVKKYVLELFM